MKKEISKRKKNSRSKAQTSQRELEKRVFHLKTLYDVSREVWSLRGPEEVMKHMLMMGLGAFGSSCGVMLLVDLKEGKLEALAQRGMEASTIERLSRFVDDGYFRDINQVGGGKILGKREGIPIKRHHLHRILAAAKLKIWMPYVVSESVWGGIGLGSKLSGGGYTRDDEELLSALAHDAGAAILQIKVREQRASLMQLFSKHVSPEVADALWQQRDQFLDGGRPRSQKLLATVLFTDLQGFTTASEKLDPQVLMDWLNAYMESITKTVMEHGGVVDDYFGDGVKVNFGVPIPRVSDTEIRQDAVNAVSCALALERDVVQLNARMKEGGLPTLRMRVGIFTGPVVAGSLGSADRMKYTTLGDTVNTASRLESFDKSLVVPTLESSPCRILIGESTLEYLGGQFDTEKVGEVSLKGKEVRIPAYVVLGRKGDTGCVKKTLS